MKLIDKQYIKSKNVTVIVVPTTKIHAEQMICDEHGERFKVLGFASLGNLLLEDKSPLVVAGKFDGNSIEVE